MGKTEAVVFLVILCVSVSLCQDLLSTRILEERSLQDALSKVEYLLDHLDAIKIKDVKGKSGSTSYELTNIRITDVGNLVPAIDFIDGFRKVKAKLTLSSITAEANWWARFKNWFISITKSGTLTAEATEVSVAVSLVDFQIADCDASVNLDVDLRGDKVVNWLVKLINGSAFMNDFESDIEDMICDEVYKI